MLRFLHQMFNLFVLLRDDSLKPATPLTNGAIDETLQQFAPLSDDCLLQLFIFDEVKAYKKYLKFKSTPCIIAVN